MKRWMIAFIAALSLLGVVASGVATAGAPAPTVTLDLNVTSIKVVERGAAAEVTYTLDCSVSYDNVHVYAQILQTSGRTITLSSGSGLASCVAGETTTGTVIVISQAGKLKPGPATVVIQAQSDYVYNPETDQWEAAFDAVNGTFRLR